LQLFGSDAEDLLVWITHRLKSMLLRIAQLVIPRENIAVAVMREVARQLLEVYPEQEVLDLCSQE